MLKIGYVKRLKQTRFGSSDFHDKKKRENSYATVIACFLGFEDAEDSLQIQEHYPDFDNDDDVTWALAFSKWIEDQGYDWGNMDGHSYDDSCYIVLGVSYRGDAHACIYKNGQLWHDPHPDGTGLNQEMYYEYLKKSNKVLQ